MASAFDVEITTVAEGLTWGEGPAFVPKLGGYVFTDIPANTIYLSRAGEVSIYRSPSNSANGNTTDNEGRLVTCEHYTRRVTRTETDGSVTVIADQFEGRPLNSPNDVVVTRDGAIWFTDPPYGLMREGEYPPGAVQEQPSGVYRVDLNGTIERVIDTLDKPNGLVFSLDEKTLFVSDTGHSHRPRGNHHIFAFEMVAGRPRNLSIFAAIRPGACDGLRVDRLGNVWSSAGDGVHCVSPDGNLIARIALGEMATNLCYLADDEGPGLFVTTPTRALFCRLKGAHTQGFCRDGRNVR